MISMDALQCCFSNICFTHKHVETWMLTQHFGYQWSGAKVSVPTALNKYALCLTTLIEK